MTRVVDGIGPENCRGGRKRTRLMTALVHKLPGQRFGHRPLNWVSVASAAASVVAVVLYFTDSRELLGVPLWEKPLKFLLSTIAYALTFSWFYSLTTRGAKTVWWLGTGIASVLVIELVVIIGLAAAGLTSHFNVSSAFHLTMWSIMATGISTLWVLSFLVGAFLWRSEGIDPGLRTGIRWGLATGLAGMGLAFTMTSPTSDQLANWEGIAGSHTVGAADGGPGLPFLGWSTVGGDLRISHFIGLHGLQLLPLLALLLAPTGMAALWRQALLHGAGVTYSLLVVVTYIQALAGESVVSPSPGTLISLGAAVGAGVVMLVAYLLLARTPRQGAPVNEAARS